MNASVSSTSMKKSPPQELADLVSIGPAALRDFQVLGIGSLEELALQDARCLYDRLCEISGAKHDPCVEDVFRAAIEQAKNPFLEAEKKQWHYWSRKRRA